MPGRSPCALFPGIRAGLAAGLLLAASPLPAVEIITVYGYRLPDFTVAEHPSDSAAFIASAPGGAVNRNGPLSGIPQYRGLHTYRVRTHVDGRQPHTAGPVWMDSPLHYLPSALVDRLEVYRGIAPVRVGPSIGGHIEAVSHTSRYQGGADYEFGARATLDGHSVDDGGNASAFLSLANDRHRYHVYGVHDEGDDMESGGGRVAGTEYERDYFGFGFGHAWGDDAELSFDYARNNTGDAGTPALPMDIGYYHTDLLNLRLRAPLGAWRLRAQAHYQDTEHWMSNYHLRPAPDFSAAPLPPFQGADRRAAEVAGESWGGKARAFIGEGDRQYLTGLRVGGSNILIAIDVSASMLDETIVNVLRRRNMPEERRRNAPKWRRAVRTVEWLAAQLPLDADFQLFAFNEETLSLAPDNNDQWLPLGDGRALAAAIDRLDAMTPTGGTSLERLAAKLRTLNPLPDNVYLVTDSLPTQGAGRPRRATISGSDRLKLFREALRQLPPQVPINVILMPMEGDPLASAAFWNLARTSGGAYMAPSKDWP